MRGGSELKRLPESGSKLDAQEAPTDKHILNYNILLNLEVGVVSPDCQMFKQETHDMDDI